MSLFQGMIERQNLLLENFCQRLVSLMILSQSHLFRVKTFLTPPWSCKHHPEEVWISQFSVTLFTRMIPASSQFLGPRTTQATTIAHFLTSWEKWLAQRPGLEAHQPFPRLLSACFSQPVWNWIACFEPLSWVSLALLAELPPRSLSKAEHQCRSGGWCHSVGTKRGSS